MISYTSVFCSNTHEILNLGIFCVAGMLFLVRYNVAIAQPVFRAMAVCDLEEPPAVVRLRYHDPFMQRGGVYLVADGDEDAKAVRAASWTDLDWGYPGDGTYTRQSRRAWKDWQQDLHVEQDAQGNYVQTTMQQFLGASQDHINRYNDFVDYANAHTFAEAQAHVAQNDDD